MNPVKKGSVRGTIYLTEYETEKQKRVRECLKSAAEALRSGDASSALASYRAVLSLDAGNAEASAGVAALEAENAKENAERQRRERTLLGYVKSGELPMREYNRALAVLEPDAATVDAADAQYRRFVDSLLEGALSLRSFLRSVEMLDAGTAETPLPAQHAPPPKKSEKLLPQPAVPPVAPAVALTVVRAKVPRRSRRAAFVGAGLLAIVVIAVVVQEQTAHVRRLPIIDASTTAASPPDPVASQPSPSSEAPAVNTRPLDFPKITPRPGTRIPVVTQFLVEFKLDPNDSIDAKSARLHISFTDSAGGQYSLGADFPNPRSLLVYWGNPLERGMQYTLQVSRGLRTVRGRMLDADVNATWTTRDSPEF